MLSDRYWMKLAYEQAIRAQLKGEVPVGAVLVDQNQELIVQACNQTIQDKDPTAHAEIVVIRQASQILGNHRLLHTTLYTTLEPCIMCAGAIIEARIKRIVFASRDFKAGAAGSVFNLLKGYPLNHKVILDEGILEWECTNLLANFFKNRR